MTAFFAKYATKKNRWIALIFLALSLAIVIIDNSVLNVSVPYILRDLNTSLDSIQWVISGYALIIATLLITMGRLGDLFGRKKIFLIGIVLFAIGSFMASISHNVTQLFIGEALIEAIGASMMMTSSLALIASEFQGRERGIAFGVWGAVAGASAAFGPLLGGYFTTYYTWRWSLRINVAVAVVAIIGSIFIMEARSAIKKEFDYLGMVFSGLGLFSLVFGLIEGRKYGWWGINESFNLGSWHWPLANISVIPVVFLLATIFLTSFIIIQYIREKNGLEPLVRLSMFKNNTFSIPIVTLLVLALGQFGVFFILPIYAQNALGFSAMRTGEAFLTTSITALIIGPISGFLTAKFNPKYIVSIGMFALAAGTYLLARLLKVDSNGLTLFPALVLLGFGIGSVSAQLTNIVLSGVPVELSGEASAVNATIRQIGTSVGVAILGAVLATALTTNITKNVNDDPNIPVQAKSAISSNISETQVENGSASMHFASPSPAISTAVESDVKNGIVTASKRSIDYAFVFVLLGAIVSLFIPKVRHIESEKEG